MSSVITTYSGTLTGIQVKSKLKESDIQSMILKYLRYRGIFAWKNHSTGTWDPKRRVFRKIVGTWAIKGVSDILGVLPGGRFLALEVKTPQRRKTASQDQLNFLSKIEELGGIASVVWNVDQVEKLLDEAL